MRGRSSPFLRFTVILCLLAIFSVAAASQKANANTSNCYFLPGHPVVRTDIPVDQLTLALKEFLKATVLNVLYSLASGNEIDLQSIGATALAMMSENVMASIEGSIDEGLGGDEQQAQEHREQDLPKLKEAYASKGESVLKNLQENDSVATAGREFASTLRDSLKDSALGLLNGSTLDMSRISSAFFSDMKQSGADPSMVDLAENAVLMGQAGETSAYIASIATKYIGDHSKSDLPKGDDGSGEQDDAPNLYVRGMGALMNQSSLNVGFGLAAINPKGAASEAPDAAVLVQIVRALSATIEAQRGINDATLTSVGMVRDSVVLAGVYTANTAERYGNNKARDLRERVSFMKGTSLGRETLEEGDEFK